MRINHATTPKAKQDTAIGTWAWGGYLDEVEYGEEVILPEENSSETSSEASTAVVYAANGKPVRLRKAPDKAAVWLAWVPVGTEVQVLEHGEEWCRVKIEGKTGYIMTQFLKWSE